MRFSTTLFAHDYKHCLSECTEYCYKLIWSILGVGNVKRPAWSLIACQMATQCAMIIPNFPTPRRPVSLGFFAWFITFRWSRHDKCVGNTKNGFTSDTQWQCQRILEQFDHQVRCMLTRKPRCYCLAEINLKWQFKHLMEREFQYVHFKVNHVVWDYMTQLHHFDVIIL